MSRFFVFNDLIAAQGLYWSLMCFEITVIWHWLCLEMPISDFTTNDVPLSYLVDKFPVLVNYGFNVNKVNLKIRKGRSFFENQLP